MTIKRYVRKAQGWWVALKRHPQSADYITFRLSPFSIGPTYSFSINNTIYTSFCWKTLLSSSQTEPSEYPGILARMASITLSCTSKPSNFTMFDNACSFVPPDICPSIRSSNRYSWSQSFSDSFIQRNRYWFSAAGTFSRRLVWQHPQHPKDTRKNWSPTTTLFCWLPKANNTGILTSLSWTIRWIADT